MWESSILGALTPKFYVALTGTSSLISGMLLIFEWWYFRKYGMSFIEQVSLAHLGPWFGQAEPEPTPDQASPLADYKVWRNPQALLRGAEYGRLWSAARQSPLTYYDMNLTAQEHQAWFGCTRPAGGVAGAVDEVMARAWRERDKDARVAAAHAALALRPDCAAALLLLAEEEATTVQEAERLLRRAWRAAEGAWRGAVALGAGAEARREALLLAHVKRREAMCLRRLGRLRDAARLFRELQRDAPHQLQALAPHENLLEVLLEQRLFPEALALTARAEEAGGAQLSAVLLYSAALLRARAAERGAPEAMRRALAFNPHVPAYLLELRALTLPPEHVVRRGDSEALAYAFVHLRHWRAPGAEPALRLLRAACQEANWSGSGGEEGSGGCARCADRELLPAHHAPPLPPRRGPALVPAAALTALLALAALAAHRPPDPRALLGLQ